MIDKRNATSSWSGYSHQGKVGIFLLLKELRLLIEKGNDFSDYKLEFEKNFGEDVDISNSTLVVSRHQIKAKTSGKYPNDYKDVRKVNSNICTNGYQISNTNSMNRFLHVICEVFGWNLNEDEFKDQYHNAVYVPNESEVQLYKYPDKKEYCPLIDNNNSPIDNFSKSEIKKILNILNHNLKDDNEHIEETLFEIKDLISFNISKSHNDGNGTFPIIFFQDIFEIVISISKRERQSIHRAKLLFEIYWNKNFDDKVDGELFNNILNLPNDVFKQFIIDLNPHKSIYSLNKIQSIDALLEEDVFEEIFFEFYKHVNPKYFELNNIKYTSKLSTYRLSLINKKYKLGEVKKITQNIINNRHFLKASFDVDYLVNGRINCPIFAERDTDEDLNLPYRTQPQKEYDIFSNNLELIDIDKTLIKLEGEKHE